MNNIKTRMDYNLEDRTLKFSKDLLSFIKFLPRNVENNVLINQVVRSATSIGANYREANESETKKEFLYRIRICRKESKETRYWLKLVNEINSINNDSISKLIIESTELLKIFAAIANKSK